MAQQAVLDIFEAWDAWSHTVTAPDAVVWEWTARAAEPLLRALATYPPADRLDAAQIAVPHMLAVVGRLLELCRDYQVQALAPPRRVN